MRIKNQILLLINLIIIIPAFAIGFIPFYHFMNRPSRYLIKDFSEVASQFKNNTEVSEQDFRNMEKHLQSYPATLDLMIFANNSILLSTIPELKTGTAITKEQLFDFISSTSNYYKYQLRSSSHFLNDADDKTESNKIKCMIISRTKIESTKETTFRMIFYFPTILVFIIFETLAITAVVFLSLNLKKSIDELEKTTESISKGNFNIPIVSKIKHKNEITKLTENLENVRISFKELESGRTRFIMGMSHDLRTPVAIIKGYTEALADGIISKPEKIKETHQLILAKISQLDLMITELINCVRLDNGLLKPNIKPQDFHEFLVACGKNISNYASIYKKIFNYNINIPESFIIDFDNLLCERLIENLISNSVRYSQDFAEISLNAKLLEDGTIILTEEDNGNGMSEEDLQHIFEIFYRGTNSRREAGMGIGLNVVKNIIEIHGWHIDVESQKGKGTKFIITIPPRKEKK